MRINCTTEQGDRMLNLALCRGMILTLICLAMGISGATAAPQQATQLQATHQKAPGARPRIGVAFEGGGALGFAHIGVIQWLEEHHIPVDYISGTSMGGLVGGVYASGMSPDEIVEFVHQINWGAVLNGRIPFTDLSFRRKEDRLAFPNRMEFVLKNGFSLPGGLNSGARVGLLLDREMLPYWDLKSFDDLPIPFRCVATEITRGEKHIFDSGSLSQALRATMSIPGLFAPVHHDNEIFSDGAALDNLPVDVARSMGADVVIASR
jgi:NTE family protein